MILYNILGTCWHVLCTIWRQTMLHGPSITVFSSTDATTAGEDDHWQVSFSPSTVQDCRTVINYQEPCSVSIPMLNSTTLHVSNACVVFMLVSIRGMGWDYIYIVIYIRVYIYILSHLSAWILKATIIKPCLPFTSVTQPGFWKSPDLSKYLNYKWISYQSYRCPIHVWLPECIPGYTGIYRAYSNRFQVFDG